MSETENYNDFLQTLALEIHKLIQDPEHLQSFQENLVFFDEHCEREYIQARDNANRDPNLRDPNAEQSKDFKWDDGNGEKNEKGYWRPFYLWERFVLDASDLPPIKDKAKKTLLDYALLATIHDQVLKDEVPIAPDGWYEQWGFCIWEGGFEEEQRADWKISKRTKLTASLSNIKTELAKQKSDNSVVNQDNGQWVKKTRRAQEEVNVLIRKYAKRHADSLNGMKEKIEIGDLASINDARKIFGRNKVADALGCSRAMVSNSPAWRSIAKQLKLDNFYGGSRKPNKRVGLDIAVEQVAQKEYKDKKQELDVYIAKQARDDSADTTLVE